MRSLLITTSLLVLLGLPAYVGCSVADPGARTLPPAVVEIAEGVVEAGQAGAAAPSQLLDAAALILAAEETAPGTYPEQAVAFARAVIEGQGEPLPAALVEVARWLIQVDATEARHGEDPKGWLDRGLDWLLLLVQGYGAFALGAGATSSRWWSMIGVALKALNPTSTSGIEAGKAFNATLAAVGARHSGELLPAPKVT